MLEHLFTEQTQEVPENKEYKSRSTKRRKMDSAHDLDDDEVGTAQGNRGGTGYAGDGREDVCYDLLPLFPSLNVRGRTLVS